MRFAEAEADGEASFKLNNVEEKRPIAKGDTEAKFPSLRIDAGEGRAEPVLRYGDKEIGVLYVDINKHA